MHHPDDTITVEFAEATRPDGSRVIRVRHHPDAEIDDLDMGRPTWTMAGDQWRGSFKGAPCDFVCLGIRAEHTRDGTIGTATLRVRRG